MKLIKRIRRSWNQPRYLLMPITESDHEQAEIRDVLMTHCPAFYFIDTGCGSIWHKCYCKDMPRDLDSWFYDDHYGPCECVWHRTDSCKPRGQWEELRFLNTTKKD